MIIIVAIIIILIVILIIIIYFLFLTVACHAPISSARNRQLVAATRIGHVFVFFVWHTAKYQQLNYRHFAQIQ